MRVVARDYHRLTLPRTVAPGETLELTSRARCPPRLGTYGLKFDLVAEGMTWFETAGSPAISRRVMVTD